MRRKFGAIGYILGGIILVVAAAAAVLALSGPKSGHVFDEAKQVGRTAASFPAADEDYFKDMDGGVALTPTRSKGAITGLFGPAATTVSGIIL